MKKATQKLLTGFASALMCSGVANAADITVSLSNLTHGNHITPPIVSAHDSSMHMYQLGMAASASLRAVAECGDTTDLLADLGGADADTKTDMASVPMAPGATTTTTITTTASYLSIVGMLLPTNDAFVGADSIEIPTTAGTYTYYLNAYDAGTEANDELLPGTACAVGVAGIPGAPGGDGGSGGSGVSSADTNTMIHVHRGVLGDTNSSGGMSDLDSTIHRWQNPVAKLVLTVQ